jgi:hypothetical protein
MIAIAQLQQCTIENHIMQKALFCERLINSVLSHCSPAALASGSLREEILKTSFQTQQG